MAETTSSQDLYQKHEPAIERALAFICARRHLSADECEEFCAEARLKLLENDAAVLRSHRGESKMSTYLVTVLSRFLTDWRRSKWGKWRPSARAQQEGTVAVRLEQLVHRDGIPFEQAAEILRNNHGVRLSVPELAELMGRLPARDSRRMDTDDVLERMPEPRPGPEAAALDREAHAGLARAARILHKCLDELDPEDRLILRLRYHEARKVVDIARALHLEQKPLYRRIDRIQGALRRCMVARGLDDESTRRLLRRKSAGESVH